MDGELTHLLGIQDGVIARRQLLELGLREHDLRRMVLGASWPRFTLVCSSTTPVR